MPNELAKNVGRLDMVGLYDYAKKRRDAMRAEAGISAQGIAEKKAQESRAYLRQKLVEANNPNANAEDNERRALMEQNRRKIDEQHRQLILRRFGEKEE